MAKAYWVNVYHAIHDEEKPLHTPSSRVPRCRRMAASSLFAVCPPSVRSGHDATDRRRRVRTPDAAIACHDSPVYQEALAALGDGVTRDMRVVEGL